MFHHYAVAKYLFNVNHNMFTIIFRELCSVCSEICVFLFFVSSCFLLFDDGVKIRWQDHKCFVLIFLSLLLTPAFFFFISLDFQFRYSKVYDTGKDPLEVTKLIQFIQSVQSPSVIMIVVHGEAFAQMTEPGWTLLVRVQIHTKNF